MHIPTNRYMNGTFHTRKCLLGSLDEVVCVEFPCLSKLHKLTITGGWINSELIRYSNFSYKSQLPELKELRFHQTPSERCTVFLNNQTHECFEKLEKLTLSQVWPTLTEIRRIPSFFPNIRKLGISWELPHYLPFVYKYIPQLEELCVMVKDKDDCVDDVITGLDKSEYLEIRRTSTWDKTIEKLESRLMVKSVAALENLKILRIYRDKGWTGLSDLNDLSLYVLKKLKNLQVLDFGESLHGRDISVPTKAMEELRERCALVCKQPSHHRYAAELQKDTQS